MKKIRYTEVLAAIILSLAIGFYALSSSSQTGQIATASYDGTTYEPYITPGASTQYLGGDVLWHNFPAVVSSTYQALVTQTGTGAPSGVQFANDFSGTTFTWARTAVGTYTVTASNPVFTTGKTAVIMSNPNAFLNNFKYAVTSTTVITLQTSTLNIITLILTPGNADGLLSNTMFYVVVYP